MKQRTISIAARMILIANVVLVPAFALAPKSFSVIGQGE